MDRVMEPEREFLQGTGRAQQVECDQRLGEVPQVVVVPVGFAPAADQLGTEVGPSGQDGAPPAQQLFAHHSPISHQASPAQAEANSTLLKVPMMNRSAAPDEVAFSSG